MEGGHVWRDVATHTAPDGKVYAYVAAQDLDNTPSHLFVFDLSELSGDIDTPNGVNSNPIEPGVNGYLDRGQSGKSKAHLITTPSLYRLLFSDSSF